MSSRWVQFWFLIFIVLELSNRDEKNSLEYLRHSHPGPLVRSAYTTLVLCSPQCDKLILQPHHSGKMEHEPVKYYQKSHNPCCSRLEYLLRLMRSGHLGFLLIQVGSFGLIHRNGKQNKRVWTSKRRRNRRGAYNDAAACSLHKLRRKTFALNPINALENLLPCYQCYPSLMLID